MSNMIKFNHIDININSADKELLMNLYHSYFKKHHCYSLMFKKWKKIHISLQMTSVILISLGGIIGSITVNPIIISSLAAAGIFVQAYITKNEFKRQVIMLKIAVDTLHSILDELNSYLRGLEFNKEIVLSDLKVKDDMISNLCPTLDEKYIKIYDKKVKTSD